MLDHCDECGTDFAYGLPACPHCQVPNARLADEAADGETPDQQAEAEETPAPSQKPPAGRRTDLPDDAPKINSK